MALEFDSIDLTIEIVFDFEVQVARCVEPH